jgi:RNA polymerase sigma-70 factor (family 1)
MNHKTSTDTELWMEIKAGNRAAFDALFKKYWSSMYASAFHYLQDDEACSDIIHDIFFNVWDKRNILEISNVKSYLIVSVRYHFLRYIRNRKIRSVIYNEQYVDLSTATDMNAGEKRLHHLDFERNLLHQLQQLPPRCREVFILSRINEYSNDKIAQDLGISKRTVENQITYALKYLRLHLKYLAVLLPFLLVCDL